MKNSAVKLQTRLNVRFVENVSKLNCSQINIRLVIINHAFAICAVSLLTNRNLLNNILKQSTKNSKWFAIIAGRNLQGKRVCRSIYNITQDKWISLVTCAEKDQRTLIRSASILQPTRKKLLILVLFAREVSNI